MLPSPEVLKDSRSASNGAGRSEDMWSILRQMEHWLQQADTTPEASPTANVERVSFVIPVKDEESTLETLYKRIAEAMPAGREHEVLFVDDGSLDNSWQVIQELARKYPSQVRGIRLRGNHGKATALMAGFRATTGGVIMTMDADLQDDPAEIARFLDRLAEGYDIVSGWKQVRHDPWHKVWPSRAFNWMLSRLGGVALHDHNCGFKCYRAEVVRNLALRGEQHRVIPSLAAQSGFRATEITVRHHPRMHGRSKYGIERLFRGWCDILSIGFLRRYRGRPSHFVHKFTALFTLSTIGFSLNTVCAWMLGAAAWMWGLTALISGGLAANFLVLGLLAELLLQDARMRNGGLPIAEDTSAAQPRSDHPL